MTESKFMKKMREALQNVKDGKYVLHMSATMSCDRSCEDAVGPLYYFRPSERRPGPYRKQRQVMAIIDIADDGTLAGVELVENMPPPFEGKA